MRKIAKRLPPPLWGRAGWGGFLHAFRNRISCTIPPSLTLPHKGGGNYRGALLLLILSSCSLAPDYQRPEMDVSAPAYKEADGWKIAEPADAALKGNWWEIFNDPELNALEEKVTTANQNLKIALAQYDEAQAAASAIRASYFPTITGNAGATRQQVSAHALSATSGTLYNSYSTGASLSYEVDVWGRVRNAVAAGEDREKASSADLANVDLSLHAELASDYFALRGYDAAQGVLDEAVVAYQKALEFNQRRHKGGAGDESDVDQAQTQLETAKTQAADTHLKRLQLEHAIAVLTGQMPMGFHLNAESHHATPPAVNPGIPSTLIERRPDIASAERQASAANADIGVARAAYFPLFNFTGGAGFDSSRASNLLGLPSSFWSVGPTAALTLFDAGRISSLSDRAHAAYDEAVAHYRQTVLTAYQQVEDNIAALRQLEQMHESQNRATIAAKRNLSQAHKRYSGGIVTYLEVVVAQNSALQAELNDYDIETRRMIASVELIKALGGGWNIPQQAAAQTEEKPQ